MTESVTLQDIYNLFQRSQDVAEQRNTDWERRFAESKAEADRHATEWERRFAESRAADERRAAEWDRKLAESKAEADRHATEWERRFAESRAADERRAAEWSRQLAESKAADAHRAAEWDRKLAESKAEADRRAAEWERQFAESKADWERRNAAAEERLAKVEAIAAQTSQAVDALTSRWGRFVENLVAPAVLRLFQERGIPVNRSFQRARGSEGGRHLEIDILALNRTVAVAVEVKSRLTQKNLRQFLKNLENFKALFPEYADRTLYGAVAAIEIDKDVDFYAYNQGLFLIEQSGDSVKISNAADFTPRAW